jgi:hypothetical protein
VPADGFRAQGFKDGEKPLVSPRRARVFLQPSHV